MSSLPLSFSVDAAPHGEPASIFRDALAQLAGALGTAGVAPAALTSMTWTAADPAAFHITRPAIDLAWRDFFGGFRPPVAVQQGDVALRIEARAGAAPVASGWGAFTAAELAREYAPRLQVSDAPALFAQWRRDGAAFRARHAALDIAYGPSAAETFDLYCPSGRGPFPVWVSLHGGFWQALDKVQNAQFSQGLLDHGFAVCNVNYGLCPQTRLPDIVAQVARALGFLAREASALGIDAERLNLTGHSAGGHLAAMAALDAEGPPLRAILPVSGVFDLAPLMALPMGRLFGLASADVARLSPLHHAAPAATRVALCVGGAESSEFRRHTTDLAKRWKAPTLVTEGANHFTVLDGFNGGALLDLALAVSR